MVIVSGRVEHDLAEKNYHMCMSEYKLRGYR